MVKDIMTVEPVCCTPDTSLEKVAKMMVDNDCGAIPVVEDLQGKKPIGIVTDRDIVCRVVAQGQNPLDMVARDCMTDDRVITVSPEAEIDEAIRLLEDNQVRRLLVIENDRLIGIVAQADLATGTGAGGEIVEAVSEPTETPSTVH